MMRWWHKLWRWWTRSPVDSLEPMSNGWRANQKRVREEIDR